MAEIIEAEGKTVEEALSAALDKLGCGRAEVTYEVLQQPSRGFLGLWGKRDARIRVTTHPVIVPQTEQRPAPPQPTYQQESPHAFSQTPRRFHTDLRTPAERTAEADASEACPSYGDASPVEERRVRRSSASLQPPAPELLARAETFLQAIFSAMHLSVTLRRIDTDTGVVYNIRGENLGILIGKHGSTLDALQYLTNLVVNKTPESGYIRIILDVEDYRARREETLTRLAGHLADKACRIGEEIHLEPMSRHERKIIHMALQDNRRVTTYSAGENPRRYVVIVPRRKKYTRDYEDGGYDRYEY